MNFVKLIVVLTMALVTQVDSHGLLLNPPARSSAWREDPARFPAYYEDNQMFCGGFQTQWSNNGGKCGICGENFSGPKLFEKGGSLYKGFSVRSYTRGQTIPVQINITANHNGYVEFRICNVDNSNSDATQSCLDKTLLADKSGNTRFSIPPAVTGRFVYNLVLPRSLTCQHCVFQWKYNAGNSWNTDPTTGQSCVGCGPQEQFYGCADVTIRAPNTFKREESSEETVDVSTGLLKRLFSELKRLKTLESELGSKREDLDVNNEDMSERSLDSDLERAFNELDLSERASSSYDGEPQAYQEAKHNDKSLRPQKRRKAFRTIF